MAAQPQLMIAQGDALHMLARFDDALAAYAEAERYYAAHADPVGQSLALRGQAQIYLDTVRPAPAQPLLRRAFKLLRLIAENRLNSGRADQAARLYRPGSTLRIQFLDRLRVWRGATEIEPRAWQRKKAPQLLALLPQTTALYQELLR